MQSIFLLTLLILVTAYFSCTKPAESKSRDTATTDDEKTLRHLKEVEWPKAYATQDTVLLDRILGNDFKMIDEQGDWYNKKDELEWISKNKLTRDSFYYDIQRLDIFDNESAIIAGTGHIYNDGKHSIYQSSNVLIKRDGVWKAVASHVFGSKEVKDTVNLKK